jgi:hypothetical protein
VSETNVTNECGECEGSSGGGLTNTSYPSCLCSETYSLIKKRNVLKNIYTNANEPLPPGANTTCPLFFSYHLPGNINYSSGSMPLNFQY